VSKRGFRPSFFFFPLSFEGEGDTGGEEQKMHIIVIVGLDPTIQTPLAPHAPVDSRLRGNDMENLRE
jgi:hypothetical protein